MYMRYNEDKFPGGIYLTGKVDGAWVISLIPFVGPNSFCSISFSKSCSRSWSAVAFPDSNLFEARTSNERIRIWVPFSLVMGLLHKKQISKHRAE